MSSSEPTPHPDPGGVQAAVDRYRDLARYLIAILAALGATLVAGTQLSSIGELSWNQDPERVTAAVLGFLLAIGSVAWIVIRALDVLRPIEMSLDEIAGDAELEADAKRLDLLGGLASVEELQLMLRAEGLSPPQHLAWQEIGEAVVGRASFTLAHRRFERAWRGMQIGGVLVIVGIVAFAWGSNPPAANDGSNPVPARVAIVLTPDGRRLIRETAGPLCARSPLQALAIGGTVPNPEVITIPSHGCRAIRMTLAASLGQAIPVYRREGEPQG